MKLRGGCATARRRARWMAQIKNHPPLSAFGRCPARAPGAVWALRVDPFERCVRGDFGDSHDEPPIAYEISEISAERFRKCQ
jgi:hypothetical protein